MASTTGSIRKTTGSVKYRDLRSSTVLAQVLCSLPHRLYDTLVSDDAGVLEEGLPHANEASSALREEHTQVLRVVNISPSSLRVSIIGSVLRSATQL